jgi:hypothetical protein
MTKVDWFRQLYGIFLGGLSQTPSVNIAYMFVGWLNGINKKLITKSWLEHLLYVGQFKNDMVSNNTRVVTPMQVIFRGTHWIRFWAFRVRTSGLTFRPGQNT